MPNRPALMGDHNASMHESLTVLEARVFVMNVRELIEILKALPDQEAIVVIGEGQIPEVWLIVSGVVERRIQVSESTLDCVGPGNDIAVEIV